MPTEIEWADETWCPISGCERVSAGCANCYAVPMARRLATMPHAKEKYAGLTVVKSNGKTDWTGVVRCHPDELYRPFGWTKPRRIFVNSMSDTFHADVPDAFLDRLFATMAVCQQHTFLLLTKRPERAAAYFASEGGDDYHFGQRIGSAAGQLLDGDWIWNQGKRHRTKIEKFITATFGDPEYELKSGEAELLWQWPLPNVWIGTSVEDQCAADERIPHLLKIPAAVRFLSCEPLLSRVDIREHLMSEGLCPECEGEGSVPVFENGEQTGGRACPTCRYERAHCMGPSPLHWIIAGGESGPGARPCNIEWIRFLVQQCRDFSVPAFVKQLGGRPESICHPYEVGWKGSFSTTGRAWWLSVRDHKGGDIEEFPDGLRVREFPAVAAPPTNGIQAG